jgi:hypothetical protein
MPTVYSSTGNQWPLLQSKTEQKFKSGLFNVSAEFIRPVGNTDLPSVIETSIGEVDVWPEPTVSVGTDGFERINATGYGVWDATAEEIVYGYEVASVTGVATGFTICQSPDRWELQTFGSGESSYQAYVRVNGCGDVPCGAFTGTYSLKSKTKQILLETVSIKKISASMPPAPALKFYDTSLNQLTELTTDWFAFGQYEKTNGYLGTWTVNPVVGIIVSFRQNKFGNIIESEAVYSLRCPSEVNFGSWAPPQPDPSGCDPGPKPLDPL